MERCSDFLCATTDDIDDRWFVAPQHDGNAGLDDPRLLRGDFLHRVAKPVAMVESDPRDDRECRVADIGRVKASAESALENRVVDLRLGVDKKSDGGQGLEEGQVLDCSIVRLFD